MYKQLISPPQENIISVQRLQDGACIPLDPANTDYQTFKTDVASGVPLEDPSGNVMTQDEVDAFLKTIP
jgi:hypothetical protein